MEEVVGGREGQIEHFVVKETGNADGDQDEAAQEDVGFGEVSFHVVGARKCCGA